MGIISAGTAVGSVLAPTVIGYILLSIGWRAVFLVAGGVGLLWVAWWAATFRPNGATLSRISALAESFQIPVVPHAGQMHNYHVVMASLKSPIAEFFPKVDVEVGNELFWYIFDGEPVR